MEFGLLGPLSVRVEGSPVLVPAAKQRVLLAMLLLHANRVVGLDELADAVWGGALPGSARVTLQNYVKRLRQVLGQTGYDRIVTRSAGYLIEVRPGELDVARFAELQAAGRAAAREGAWELASGRLTAGLALWRGRPLADVCSPLLAQTEGARLAEMRLDALEARIDADLHLGRHREVIAELDALATAEPLRERLHELLMLALFQSGRRAEALGAYRRVRRYLVEEIGIEPRPALRDLNQRIQRAGERGPWLAQPGGQAVPPRQAIPVWPPEATGRPGRGVGPAAAGPRTGPWPQIPRLPVPRLAVPRRDGPHRKAPLLDAPRHDAPRLPAAHQETSHQETSRRETSARDVPCARTADPANLPAGLPAFAGRAAELKQLSALAGRGREPAVVTIGGTAGVGKTALAVHWARQHAGRYPDGQLYVNLGGFGPTDPLTPAETLRGFLDALGIPAPRIPATLQARQALYRSLLADRTMLILLDNARDPTQIRPLLPASPATLTLITSRNELTGLIAADGAWPLALDVLTDADARDLLARRLADPRLADDPAATELVTLCARLPLALAVTATRAAAGPRLRLADLAAELSDTRSRLDVLGRSAGPGQPDTREVLRWSYIHLELAAARLFRLLGVHPGPDITAPAAASLAGVSLPEGRRLLRELARGHLITECSPGRYGFHGLLRAYAAEQAQAVDTDEEVRAATARALDHYLHSAWAGAFMLNPAYQPADVTAPRPGVTPERMLDAQQALAWFEAERRVLDAAVVVATETGFEMHGREIPSAVAEFLRRRDYWARHGPLRPFAVPARS